MNNRLILAGVGCAKREEENQGGEAREINLSQIMGSPQWQATGVGLSHIKVCVCLLISVRPFLKSKNVKQNPKIYKGD